MSHFFKLLFLSFLGFSLVFSPGVLWALSLQDLQNQTSELLNRAQTTTSNSPINNTPTTCYNFTSSLHLASQDKNTAGQVSKLQQFLKTAGYYTGPVGGIFGYSTEKAVQLFQRQYNIVSSGTYWSTGYGAVGPKTRAQIRVVTCIGNNTINNRINTSSSTTCYNFTSSLHLASQDKNTAGQVSKLQQFLKTAGYYTGPVGGIFGYNTENAVKTFQRQAKIVSSGTYLTTGYGSVGPKTRAQIRAVTCNQVATTVFNSDPNSLVNGDGNLGAVNNNSFDNTQFLDWTDNNVSDPNNSQSLITAPDTSNPVIPVDDTPTPISVTPPPSTGSGSAVINIPFDLGQAPFTVLFNAGYSQGSISTYDWNFSDSNNEYPATDEGRLVGHRFDRAGTYTVSLRTKDVNGNVLATASKTITVLNRPSGAKIYYLAGNGNDAWTGLCSSPPSTGTCGPWKTIAKLKASASTISANGVQILFRRGDTFDTGGSWFLGSLLRPLPHYLTLGAYGSGAQPVIEKITGSLDPTSALFNISNTSGRGVIVKDLHIKGNLWIRPSYSNGSFVWPGVQAILRNISISNGNLIMWGSEGVVLEGVDINATGVGSETTSAFLTDRNPGLFYINRSKIHGANSHCVYLSGSAYSVLVENNELYNCGTNPSRSRPGFTIHGNHDNIIIRSNQIHHNGLALGLDANVGYPDVMTRILVEANNIYGQTSHVFQLASLQNSIIRNNNIHDNPGTSQPVFWIKAASSVSAMTNLQVYGNTLSNNSGGLLNVDGTVNDTRDLHFKNNRISGGTTPLITDHRVYSSSNIRSYLDFSGNTYTGFSNTSILFVTPLGQLNLPAWLAYEAGGSPVVDPPVSNPETVISNPPVEETNPTPSIPPPVVNNINLNSGLMAYFSFDAFTGKNTDDSVSGGQASCVDSATYTCPSAGSGKIGNDLVFNGSSSYMRFSNNSQINPTQAMTISVWVKPVSWAGGDRRILQKAPNDSDPASSQYRLSSSGGQLAFAITGFNTLTAPLPPTNTWSHLVALYDGSSLKLYQNGQLVSSTSASGPIPTTNYALFIGTKTNSSPSYNYFNGEIDEVRLYNRALNLSEIQTLAGAPVTIKYSLIRQLAGVWFSLQEIKTVAWHWWQNLWFKVF